MDSPFYEWLVEHEDLEEDLGLLARFVVGELRWPSEEEDPEKLRTYLQENDRDDLVPLLGEAVAEYRRSSESTAANDSLPVSAHTPQQVDVAAAAVLPWLLAGAPDVQETIDMAAKDDVRGLLISGTRLLVGPGGTQPECGTQLLEKAFNAGCIDAAVILSRYFRGLDGADNSKSIEWMLKGARQGNLECMARVIALHRMELEGVVPRHRLPEEEIAEWLNNPLLDSGLVEFYCAQIALDAGRPQSAMYFFEASIAGGYTPAFIKYADLLLEEGDEDGATPILREGASAGCPKCRGALAAMYFAENPHSPVQDAQDRLKDAEAAAEHGCVHSAILAATLYRDGKVAPQNKDKAELYAVLALTFGDDSLQQMGEDLMDELVGEGSGYWETPDALSLWLFRKAIKTQSPEMLRQAAEIWLLIGMTSPRP